jgi:hypothetical protein
MSNRRTQLIDKNKNPVAYLGSVSGARYIDGLKWYVEDGGVGSGHSAESHFFRSMFHFPRKMQTSVAKLSSKIGARNFGE